MTVSFKTWFLVAAVAVVAVGLALTPLWVGYRASRADEILASLGRDDEYVYLAWIRQAKEGEWLLNNPFTLETHRRLYFNPLFILMGKLSRVFSLEPFTVFNLFRVIGGASLVICVFLFLNKLIKDRRWLMITLFLIGFAGGLGYLSYSQPPLLRNGGDLFWASRSITEARFIPSILFYPQSPISVSLILIIWSLFFRLRQRFDWISFLLQFGAGSLLVTIHPYDLVLVLLMPLSWVFLNLPVKGRDFLALTLLFLALLPASLTFLIVSRLDPVYLAWTQVKQASPAKVQWLVLYAPILPLTLVGFLTFLRREKIPWLGNEARILAVWFAWLPILLYLPVNFQRRLAEGAYLPLAFLAGVGVWRLSFWRPKLGLIIALVLLLISLPDYPFQVYQRIRVLRWDPWGGYYLPQAKLAGFSWLDRYTRNDEAVLAYPEDGLYIPAYSGNRVYFGHWANTIDSEAKANYLAYVFRPAAPADLRKDFVERNQISYLFAGKVLPEPVGPKVFPWNEANFLPTFENDHVAVFRVVGFRSGSN